MDVDEFYTTNQDHEAGFFYRKHLTKHYNKPSNKILNHLKEINIYSSNLVINKSIFQKIL